MMEVPNMFLFELFFYHVLFLVIRLKNLDCLFMHVTSRIALPLERDVDSFLECCGTHYFPNESPHDSAEERQRAHSKESATCYNEKNMEEFMTRSPFMEMIGVGAVESMTRPGAIKTHLPFSKQPYSPQAKYVYVSRNPYDCCVSYFYHCKSFPSTTSPMLPSIRSSICSSKVE
ncbi:hypothetical protein HPB51_017868 [Rhipicephalus microplus]|uniref:Sulfotransferase domain-containing protein n=1 Tax=Rhipicephalus microplus TaxID=6941 RepID=A0A9J6E334_RHIMP|nr:hypothetical protein HPB51_017868 [Rhipicephalus microplus]